MEVRTWTILVGRLGYLGLLEWVRNVMQILNIWAILVVRLVTSSRSDACKVCAYIESGPFLWVGVVTQSRSDACSILRIY